MIFVTVGTHEQPFDRLIKEVDRLVSEGFITEEVFIQTGFSTYTPQYCSWKKFLSYDEMNTFIEEANVVITHGGPATFMAVLSKGKKPIVVPRLKQFNEHVNDHQLEFARAVLEQTTYNFYLLSDFVKLVEIIENVKQHSKDDIQFSNSLFNIRFHRVVEQLFKGGD